MDEKQYGVSISKDILASLPAASCSVPIRLVDTPQEAEYAAEILSQSDIIGFDTETRPSFRKGQHFNVALMQLSTRTECFLIRLNHIGLPEAIRSILENKNILKIGLSIKDDFNSLHKAYELNPDGFIDLQAFVKQFGIVDNSLSRIYAILFNQRISKGQRLSNWETDHLSQHQQEYAALDALACITIYDQLTKHAFNPLKSSYYKLIYDPTTEESETQS